MTDATTPRETAKTIAAWWNEIHGAVPNPIEGIELIARLFRKIGEQDNPLAVNAAAADTFIGVVAFSAISTAALEGGQIDEALFGILKEIEPKAHGGLTYADISEPVLKMAKVIVAEATIYANFRHFADGSLKKSLTLHTTQFITIVLSALIGICKTNGAHLSDAVQERMATNRSLSEVPL